MTLKDYLEIVRQRLLVVLLTIFLTTGAAVIFTLRQAPTYEAKSRLLVIPLPLIGSGSELTTKYGFQRGVATEAEIVKSAEVAKRVIQRLNLNRPPLGYDADSLIRDMAITPLQYTEVLEIKVFASDPRLASDIANAIPEEYIQLRRDQAVKEAQEGSEQIARSISTLLAKLNQLDDESRRVDLSSPKGEFIQRQKDQIVAQMASLETTRQTLIGESPLKNGGVGQIIAFAKPSPKRANADLARTVVLGLIIGIPLALGLALLLDAMSDTIKSKEEAERIVGAEALGIIPLTPEWRSRKPFVVSREAPYSAAAEAFRTLRINLDSRGGFGSDTRRILFTSPGMGEGKTTTTANVGVAYAEAGRSALMISADLRRPKLHRMFGAEPGPGLAEILADPNREWEAVVECSPNLYLLPSGQAEERPDQLLNRADVRQTLDDISIVPRVGRRHRPRNDENGPRSTDGSKTENSSTQNEEESRQKVVTQPNIVLLDSPSVLGAAEVSALAKAVDGVILVLHSGVTRREAAARAAEQVRRAGGTIVGLVLVGVRVDNDYSVYLPYDESDGDDSNSAWSRVLSTLRR